MQFKDLTDNQIACSAQLSGFNDIDDFGFELKRRFGHSWWANQIGIKHGEAGFSEFINAFVSASVLYIWLEPPRKEDSQREYLSWGI